MLDFETVSPIRDPLFVLLTVCLAISLSHCLVAAWQFHHDKKSFMDFMVFVNTIVTRAWARKAIRVRGFRTVLWSYLFFVELQFYVPIELSPLGCRPPTGSTTNHCCLVMAMPQLVMTPWVLLRSQFTEVTWRTPVCFWLSWPQPTTQRLGFTKGPSVGR